MADLRTALLRAAGSDEAFDMHGALRIARCRTIERRVMSVVAVVALIGLAAPVVFNAVTQESGVVGRIHREEQQRVEREKRHQNKNDPQSLRKLRSAGHAEARRVSKTPRLSVDRAIAQLGLTGRIAYRSPCAASPCSPTGMDIYVLDLRTGRTSQITHASINAYDPAWSPDGLRIAFSLREENFVGLYSMQADGSDVRRLFALRGCEANDPTWSPDGRRIAFRLYRTAAGCRPEDARYTPYVDWSDLWTVGADGTGAHALAGSADEDTMDPEWSPDGDRIAYTTWGDDDVFEVSAFDLATGGYDTITRGAEPSWSPDASTLVFAGGEPVTVYGPGIGPWQYHEIRMIRPDGSDERLVRSTTEFLFSPTWSPDGKWIAVVSDPDGSASPRSGAIWVMRPDGTGARKLIDDATQVAWGPPA